MLIAAKFIKFNVTWFSVHLSQLFNVAFKSATFPDDWKSSYLVPVPKKGRRNLINNYRGIALQSIIPKLFDQILTKKIQACIMNIIPPQQHGFIPGRITTTNLIETTQFVRENI